MKIKPLNVLFNILAIITAVSVIFVAFNIISGAKGYAVITDSMSPVFNRGDAVFVKKADFSSVNEGDVVTVMFPDGSGYFTHRVISVDRNAQMFRTKGDASESEDPQPSSAEQIAGKVWYSVPLLGYVSIFISSLNLIKISVILAVILIALVVLTTVIQKTKKSESRGGSNEQS